MSLLKFVLNTMKSLSAFSKNNLVMVSVFIACAFFFMSASSNLLNQEFAANVIIIGALAFVAALFILSISDFSFKESIAANFAVSAVILYSTAFLVSGIGGAYNQSKGFQIGHAIEEADRNSDFIKAIETRDKFIFAEGVNCSTYKIQIEDPDSALHVQEFEAMSYTRNIQDDAQEWRSVCNNIKLTQSPVPVSQIGSEIQKGQYIQALNNFLAALLDEKINGSRIRIYLKGYADAQTKEWSRSLLPEYWFDRIPYYQATDSIKTIYHISESNKRFHIISSGQYSNKDLPFLRSMFVFEKYFKDFLQICLDELTGGGILQGEVLPTKDSSKRTTELFVAVCPDDIKQ